VGGDERAAGGGGGRGGGQGECCVGIGRGTVVQGLVWVSPGFVL
jgi:hypothetical protein